ncbi:MAG: enoyl-CoA hydratase/isomerase family protein [Mycobacteriales bacterium]
MGFVRYETDNGIALVTIDRPEKRNAMTYAVLEEFIATIERAGADDAVRAVVLTGAGGAFCAGTDLSDLSGTPEGERGGRGGSREPWPIVACPKPVVAAVDGPAVGMGAEFTVQCDLRVASTRARFAWNFVHRGLVPDTGAGSWLLPRQVGLPTALRFLYSGAFVSAEEALAVGYVTAVVAPEDVVAEGFRLAAAMSAGSPFAVSRTKRLVYDGLGRDRDDHLTAHRTALTECFGSADHREGVASFLERREPHFTGR